MASIGTRKSITLIDETPTLEDGKSKPNSEEILKTWADVRMNNGFRDVSFGQTQIGRFFEFRFRYRGDITVNANCSIIYDGVKRKVHSLEKEKEKKFYWIVRAESKSFE